MATKIVGAHLGPLLTVIALMATSCTEPPCTAGSSEVPTSTWHLEKGEALQAGTYESPGYKHKPSVIFHIPEDSGLVYGRSLLVFRAPGSTRTTSDEILLLRNAEETMSIVIDLGFAEAAGVRFDEDFTSSGTESGHTRAEYEAIYEQIAECVRARTDEVPASIREIEEDAPIPAGSYVYLGGPAILTVVFDIPKDAGLVWGNAFIDSPDPPAERGKDSTSGAYLMFHNPELTMSIHIDIRWAGEGEIVFADHFTSSGTESGYTRAEWEAIYEAIIESVRLP